MAGPGRLLGLGVGPGDPELITVKALRLLRAAPVVAYLVAKGRKGNAFSIIEAHLRTDQTILPLVFPVTTEHLPPPLCYETVIADFYDEAASQVAAHLDQGRDVAVICEGDPFFYGSFMYLHDRLAERYPTEVVPGVCSVVACASVLGTPLAYRNQSLAIHSGVLPEAELAARLAQTDAAAIMKLGTNFEKVRRVVTQLGHGERALYIERATMANQRSLPLLEVDAATVPYFSIILNSRNEVAGVTDRAAAIVILGDGSLTVARRVRDALPGSTLHGLAGRVTGADILFDDFGETLRGLFRDDVPIVAICAAGIVIRALVPVLQDKRAEPPVLALAEDGSAVVPLLGGLRGVNALARAIGTALDTAPAITTTGEVRFGATLENLPDGYTLRNQGDGKRFMSDLLAGARVRLSGHAPWLAETRLPIDPDGTLAITVTPHERAPAVGELIIHPRAIAIGLAAGDLSLPDLVMAALARQNLSPLAVGVVVAAERDAARPEIHAVAAGLGRPLRFVAQMPCGPADLARVAVPDPTVGPVAAGPVAIAVAASPIDQVAVGRARGRLAVVGLGPGAAGWMAPDARRELAAADDIVGYETYVRMAGPFRPSQAIHASDNREEMDRARHALALAAQGRAVAIVSSGDPGVFAMAAAVMEALEASDVPGWHGVALVMIPGITAAHAAAARAGAPLGHDFCVISLSDNLKPWPVIEQRLALAATGDLAMALYNPVSRARPWQFGRAVEIIRGHRAPQTPVVLGRDIGRPDESLRVVRLEALSASDVDMRTVVIIGSSTTRTFPRADGGAWVYTPRSYGDTEQSS